MRSVLLFCLLSCIICSCVHPLKPENSKIENLYYAAAFKFRSEGNADSAFSYYNQAKDFFQQHGDSLGIGKCLINMAIISTDHGDYFGGQELSLDAIPYFKSDSSSQNVYIKSNYNNLGIASYNLKQYDKAIDFYHQSLQFTSDSADALVIQNNIAHAYQSKGDYAQALSVYHQILPKISSRINYARVLSNEAYTRWLQQPQRNVAAELRTALAIRKKESDLWGQCASEGYLSDYYLFTKPDSAKYFALQMFNDAVKLKSPDDQIDALKKLVRLSQPQESKNYFEHFQYLKDSLETVRNAARNQFAWIRYETEKYKAESTQRAYQISRQHNWIILILICFSAFIGFGLFWYRKRKERLALEAENKIKEHQLKTSRKVHDVIANGLYRLLSIFEHQQEIDRQQMLDDMELLYEKSRAISHDEDDYILSSENTNQSLPEMLRYFEDDQTALHLQGYSLALWNKLTPAAQAEIKFVLQELMVNMKKHSQAREVTLTFENDQNQVHITYTDDGIGKVATFQNGYGLTSTENRIHALKGQLIFDQEWTKGLKLKIIIPTL